MRLEYLIPLLMLPPHSDIYLAGISFQLFNMLVFVALVVEFFIRLRLARRRRGLAASKEGLAEQASTPEDSFAVPLETAQQKRAVKLAVWGLLVASFMIIFRVGCGGCRQGIVG